MDFGRLPEAELDAANLKLPADPAMNQEVPEWKQSGPSRLYVWLRQMGAKRVGRENLSQAHARKKVPGTLCSAIQFYRNECHAL